MCLTRTAPSQCRRPSRIFTRGVAGANTCCRPGSPTHLAKFFGFLKLEKSACCVADCFCFGAPGSAGCSRACGQRLCRRKPLLPHVVCWTRRRVAALEQPQAPRRVHGFVFRHHKRMLSQACACHPAATNYILINPIAGIPNLSAKIMTITNASIKRVNVARREPTKETHATNLPGGISIHHRSATDVLIQIHATGIADWVALHHPSRHSCGLSGFRLLPQHRARNRTVAAVADVT